MAIQGVVQPEILPVDSELRLRRFDGDRGFALAWYQDGDTLYLVDGKRTPYTRQRLGQMYSWLAERGELYVIELLTEGVWRPVGDVTFWQEDMPMVIGDPACRGKHIGRRVVSALVERGRALGYDRLWVEEIYDWNVGSQRCYTAAGFTPAEKTEQGSRYVITL